MKTKRMTRAFFSADPPTVNVRLPESWSEVTQAELRGVYEILCRRSNHGHAGQWVALFRFFTGAKVLRQDGEDFYLLLKCRQGKKMRRVRLKVTAMQLAEQLEPLSFVSSPGNVPVRLDTWHGAVAVDPSLHGVPFGQYLQIENLYQGYISSQGNVDVFVSLASLLYPGVKLKYIDDVFIFGVLQWMVQLKELFCQMWPNFFKRVNGAVSGPSMLEVMNNEIRALTGGDVTKEDVVFESDCWRALTELDYKAREADELKRISSKH